MTKIVPVETARSRQARFIAHMATAAAAVAAAAAAAASVLITHANVSRWIRCVPRDVKAILLLSAFHEISECHTVSVQPATKCVSDLHKDPSPVSSPHGRVLQPEKCLPLEAPVWISLRDFMWV